MGTGKIQTTLRVNEENFREAKKILERCGLTMSQAFNIFVAMIREHKGLPFEIKIPNKETQRVINDSRKGRNLIPISDVEELRRRINEPSD
jgi:DNA-damage-inducible protein J